MTLLPHSSAAIGKSPTPSRGGEEDQNSSSPQLGYRVDDGKTDRGIQSALREVNRQIRHNARVNTDGIYSMERILVTLREGNQRQQTLQDRLHDLEESESERLLT